MSALLAQEFLLRGKPRVTAPLSCRGILGKAIGEGAPQPIWRETALRVG